MSEILLAVYQTKVILAETTNERNEAGTPRMRALPGQTLTTLDGKEEVVDTKLNIQCKSKPREENPIGTKFELFILEKKQFSERSPVFYSTADYGDVKVHKP
jgi:hypothetical protein